MGVGRAAAKQQQRASRSKKVGRNPQMCAVSGHPSGRRGRNGQGRFSAALGSMQARLRPEIRVEVAVFAGEGDR